MSYSLELYIPYYAVMPDGIAGRKVGLYDQLRFNSDYRILGQLTDLIRTVPTTIRGRPLPADTFVVVYGDEGPVETRSDGCDQELTFLYAEDLKRLQMPEDASSRNRAIKAFIDALSNPTPIILMWR